MSQQGVSFPPPPPPGLNYIPAIRSSLNFILVFTPLGAVLIPLIIILFVFSPPRSRRHPVFILNILACCSGIALAVVNAALEVNQILYPLEPISKGLLMAVIALPLISAVFIDSILLFRILAFYPIGIASRTTVVAILAFPLLLKCGRLVVITIALNMFSNGGGNLGSLLLDVQSAWTSRKINQYILAEWVMQMVDNTYASSIFLYKIWEFRRNRKDIPVIRSRSLLSYLQSFFLIALGNFVFPIIMNIISIVFVATDSSFVKGSYVIISNNYVSILGVVFATIWTRKQSWNRREVPFNFKGHPHLTEVHAESRFAFDPTLNTRSVLSTLQFGPGIETELQGTTTFNLAGSFVDVELVPNVILSGLGKKAGL